MKLALDIGNVLCRVHLEAFTGKLMELGHVRDHSEGILFLEGIQASTDIGLHDIRGAVLRSFVGMTVENLALLQQAWQDAVVPVEEINKMLDELSRDYPVALLSNIGIDHAKFLEAIPAYKHCYHHFSYEVGARKPSKLYFQSFLIEHPEFKSHTLFIDDRVENLQAAYRAGFEVCQFNLEDYQNNYEAAGKLHDIIDNAINNGIFECTKKTAQKFNLSR